MTSNDLMRYCDSKKIRVFDLPFAELPSCSSQLPNGKYFIGIINKEMTEAERKVYLSHELGHCETNSFYHTYSPLELRSRHEHRAKMWQIKKLLPKCSMQRAMRTGCTEVWQLADHFNVTESLVRFAMFEYFDVYI